MADAFGGRFYPAGLNAEKAESKDTLWLKITPYKMIMDNINARQDNVTGIPTVEDPMWFLMPMEFLFSVQHTWEDLTTPASALREIAAKFATQAKVTGATTGLTATETGNKADNPFLYSDSARREFSLNFEFSAYNSAEKDVYEPVQNLVEYSCPDLPENKALTEFQFPYIFGLQTYTGQGTAVPILSIRKVALTSVQPNYKGPWIDGYPSMASVDLTFVDLNPLYRTNLKDSKARNITIRRT